MAGKEKIIDLRDIINRFGAKTVHDGLNLQVEKGEVLGLVGGSGSGKSVLLRVILGLQKPAEGVVRLFGKDPYTLKEEDRRALFEKIGVLFQDGALFSGLNVLDNVAFPLREYRRKQGDIEARAKKMIKLVGLEEDAACKFPSELSGGMTRRAALARALVLEPDLLLLDEPTGPLDPVAANAFDDLILKLKDEMDLTVLIITHDLNTLVKICTRIAMIVDKKIIAGTLQEMRSGKNASVKSFFQGERMKQMNIGKAAEYHGT